MGDALEPFLIPFSPPLSSEALDLSPAPLEDSLWGKKKFASMNLVLWWGRGHICACQIQMSEAGVPFLLLCQELHNTAFQAVLMPFNYIFLGKVRS